MVWSFSRLCKWPAKTDCCEAPQGTAGALEGIMLAGSMIRNTNWTRVNAQLIKWTGGDTGTWASMSNAVGEWTASAGKTVGQMWNNVTSSLTSVYENVAGNLKQGSWVFRNFWRGRRCWPVGTGNNVQLRYRSA